MLMVIHKLPKRVSHKIKTAKMISTLNPPFLSPPKPISFKTQYPKPNSQLAESTHSRVSLTAKSAVQNSLFDYLHCTRGLHYIDAEHISKNSPSFVLSLLSLVDDERETARAVSRFLRYNPINEFEPFLESLGLSSNEVTNHLPRNLMFLFDNQTMLDNFHVLCNYGVPRGKMGKIYKEGNEIFGYGDGLLGSKIKAYEELGLSKSMVIKLICCSPLLLVGDDVDKGFVEVFEKLKKLGFGEDWIRGYLSEKGSYSWNRMVEMIGFLVNLGYSEGQMRVLFEKTPSLLFEGSGKKLYVLVGGLLKSGIRTSEMYTLFLQDTNILSAKCVENLWQAMCFLFEIGMESEYVGKIISTNMKSLGTHSLKRPRTVMRNLRVDKISLCRILKEDYSNLLTLASRTSTNQLLLGSHVTFLDKTTFLLRLGFVENSDEMIIALKKFRGRGDQLQERFDCLVNAGLDSNDVKVMVTTAPSILNQSKEVLQKKIECLRTCLKYPVDSIVVFPSYLCYDLDRINARFSMYKWLRERGVVKPMLKLSTLLVCSDARFAKYFVDKDPEGPKMWEQFRKSLQSS